LSLDAASIVEENRRRRPLLRLIRLQCVSEPVFAVVAKACPFFDTVDAESISLLEAGSRRVSFDRGQILFLKGEAPDAAFLIAKGLVRVFVTDLDGTETTMSILGDQELLGELGIIDSGARAASAIALRTTLAYRIPAELLATELPKPGSIGHGLMRGLVSVVRKDTKQLVIERSQRLERAVARALTEDPEMLQRTSQGELAALLGISRQSLNHTLRAWEREGLIDRANGHMHLTDLAALRQRYLAG
jgi:CRP/FNR family transcriptional regulator, cyclic AMP receptor protein